MTQTPVPEKHTSERERLEQALAVLEAQRAVLGDAVVEVALAPLRERLAALPSEAGRRPEPPAAEQRLLATVLFADLAGFTALAETMDAEEVQDMLRRLWARLDRVILEHGGHIDKHLGDGVLAVWGIPQQREDDAVRAVQAGLALQAAVALEPGAQMRLGINTGLVSVSQIASTGERNVIGDPVNLAARLQEAAPVGGVLIGQASYEQVRGLFEVQAQPPLVVHGKAEPVQTGLVLRERARAFAMPTRGVAGVATRTVGRAGELAVLQEAFEQSVAGPGLQWVTVVGEAGVGKSRLLAEFEQWLDRRPEAIWYFKSRAWPQTRSSPYAMLRDTLFFRFQIGEADPVVVAQDRLTAGLGELLGPALGEEAAAFIGQLVGLDLRQSRWIAPIAEDTRQIRGRAEVLLRAYLAGLCAAGPAVLLLEDLHWADDESLEVFSALLGAPPAGPLCVVGLARPVFWERGRPWGQDAAGRPLACHRRLELTALDTDQAGELVRELLQKVDNPPAWLIELLIARGEGHPYFTEELVRWLLEQGVIEAGVERWRAHPDRPLGLSVPGTVQGVLQARMERLGQEERATLQRAAVVGRSFWTGAVDYIGQEAVPPERWQALQSRDLVLPEPVSRLPGQAELDFKHVLLRDVVYEYTLKKVRRLFHRRAAEWLTQVAADRVAEWAGVIAGHYELAGERESAAEWYGQAGKQAQDTFAPEAAIGYYHKALALWPQDESHGERQIGLQEGLGKMLSWRSRYSEAIAAFEAMRAAAEEVGDRAAQVRAWGSLADVRGKQGDLPQALACAEQAEMAARAGELSPTLTAALVNKAWVHCRYGDTAQALALAGEALELATALEDRQEMANSITMLGAAHWLLGNYREMARCVEQALAWSRELGNRWAVSTLLNNLGANAYMQGDCQGAVAWYREALRVSQEIGLQEIGRLALSNLGGALAGLGEYAAAEASLRQVLQLAGDSGWYELPNTYRFLAEAYLGQGQVAAAREAAQRALELARQMGAQDLLGRAWRTLGLVVAQLPAPLVLDDRAYDAPACFTASLGIFDAKQAEGERARTLRDWGRYELDHGEPARGAAMWQEARELFALLGMEELARQMGPA